MKLKKQQVVIVGVIIIALILVASVAVVLNTGENGSSNGAGNDDGTNGDTNGTGDGEGDYDDWGNLELSFFKNSHFEQSETPYNSMLR